MHDPVATQHLISALQDSVEMKKFYGNKKYFVKKNE